MEDRILELEDKSAVHILISIAKSRGANEKIETEWSPEISNILEAEFGQSPATQKATTGDAARQALLLLSVIPEYQAPLIALVNGPKTESFTTDPVTIAAVVTAALMILQTHVKFERDKQGKWTVKVEKKATSDRLLKPLVQKLLSLMKGP